MSAKSVKKVKSVCLVISAERLSFLEILNLHDSNQIRLIYWKIRDMWVKTISVILAWIKTVKINPKKLISSQAIV